MIAPSRTTVIGGGLAGSLLALHLAELGHHVDVFEKRSDLRSSNAPGGRSINLAISMRGLVALERVGIVEKVLSITIPMRGRMIHAVNGETLLQPYSRNAEEFIRSVSRAELNRVILEAASTYPNVRIRFESPCVSYDCDTSTVTLESGESIPAAVLFGADGAGSIIRRSLQDAGRIESTTELLQHGYKELKIMPDPDGLPRLSQEALHIWPRGEFMLIALPNLDGSFTCTLFMPLRGAISFQALTNPDESIRFMKDHFPDACLLMPDVVEQLAQNPVGTLGTVRCAPWNYASRADNVCLIGDAAHAIVPFFGQGMNCAFEDCTVLRDILDNQPESWDDALSIFSESRVPNANAIADMALENYAEMRDHVNNPEYTLRRQVGFELERRFPGEFIPRYSLVSFRTTPYTRVREIGKKQRELLARLTKDKSDVSQIDWAAAEQEVRQLR
ncbi:MAG: FAD-dependent monooxygenase [Bacteroidetes bacterium]|nr:MAG: FAD-dependent monooxygenase [Bacteroidota bacterium]